eukprot:582129-Amphidinium_carterae.1
MKRWEDLSNGVTCSIAWKIGDGPYTEHTWKAYLYDGSLRWTLQYVLPAWGVACTTQRPAARHLADKQKSFLATLSSVGLEGDDHYGASMLALQRAAAASDALSKASQNHWVSTEALIALHACRVQEKVTRK